VKKFRIKIGDKDFIAEIERIGKEKFKVIINDREMLVEISELPTGFAEDKIEKYHIEKDERSEDKVVKAMLPGTVVKILLKEGDRVNAGQPILILEAMKMENEIVSPKSGILKEIKVKEGQKVETNDILAIVE